MRTLRLALWGLLGIGAAVFAFLLATRDPAPAPQVVTFDDTDVQASLGGRFTLTGADGQPFDSASLQGTPYALFFGFTHCPDVCPTTLARLVKLRRDLGDDAAFAIVFVTVDPERDGPEEVGKYAELFDTPIIGLTGSREQIETVKKQYGVFGEKVGEDPDTYNVEHTASVFLIGKDGKFVATIAPEEGREAALAKLKRIVG